MKQKNVGFSKKEMDGIVFNKFDWFRIYIGYINNVLIIYLFYYYEYINNTLLLNIEILLLYNNIFNNIY